MPTVAIWVQQPLKHSVWERLPFVIFWHPGSYVQPWASECLDVKNYKWRSGTGCFKAVPIWQQWASKSFNAHTSRPDSISVQTSSRTTRICWADNLVSSCASSDSSISGSSATAAGVSVTSSSSSSSSSSSTFKSSRHRQSVHPDH